MVAGLKADYVHFSVTSDVTRLVEAGLVDEYRLLTFPSFLGGGTRLFDAPVDLELVAVSAAGPASLATYRRTPGDRNH